MIEVALVVGILLICVVLGLVVTTWAVSGRVAKALPPDGKFVTIDGHRLHYVDSADADPSAHSRPALVLAHGLGAQMRHLTHSLMERLTGEFRVIALDRPGAGWSARAKGSSHSMFEQAATLVHFAEALELERPVLVGHSLGGTVATCVALDHPDAFAGIALISPATHSQAEPPEIFKGAAIENRALRRTAAWTLATPELIRTGATLQIKGFAPETAPDDFATRGGGLHSLRPGNFVTTAADMAAARDDLPAMMARYEELRERPIALIHGAADDVVGTANNAVEFARRTGCELVLLEGGGHMIPVTQADAVADFVARHARAWTRSERISA